LYGCLLVGQYASVADLDTELLTRLSAWQSAVSSLSPIDELGWLYVVYTAGPQLLGQGFPSACQMSLLIGRARAGNLRRHDRSGDGTLRRSSLSRTSLPARTRQAEQPSKKKKKAFQSPAREALGLTCTKRPSSKLDGLSIGPLLEEGGSGGCAEPGFAGWSALLLLSQSA
jgi:hypothetical protein